MDILTIRVIMPKSEFMQFLRRGVGIGSRSQDELLMLLIICLISSVVHSVKLFRIMGDDGSGAGM